LLAGATNPVIESSSSFRVRALLLSPANRLARLPRRWRPSLASQPTEDSGVGPGGGGVGVGGGGDVELVSKTLQFEHKLFYFDLKENPWGRYLKISEKTLATRSTIIVPVDGVPWFLDLFDYYILTDERDAFSKELRLQTKVLALLPSRLARFCR
jgi:hypothetical protein